MKRTPKNMDKVCALFKKGDKVKFATSGHGLILGGTVLRVINKETSLRKWLNEEECDKLAYPGVKDCAEYSRVLILCDDGKLRLPHPGSMVKERIQ